ncbi:MAG: hypothetical protein LBB57_02770 [Clostridiales Family XIII bacterium]|jgi:hypothetical protein|nr:hypothetical protein [Clostridiales Family XIII bacterium]
MRKSIGVFFAVLLALFLSTAVVFAEELRLVNNYPEEGSRSSPPINLGIKLFFDRDVASEQYREQNESGFKLLDDEGKSVPLKVLYTAAEPNYILVIAEPEDVKNGLGSDREYRFEISPDLQATDGSMLETQKVITFRTRNTSMDMNINMVLMGLMFVGMLVFSALSMRRQAKKTATADDKQKVNPYKVAKETGKSVAAVVAKEEKRKQRVASRKKTPPDAGKDGDDPAAESAFVNGRRVKRVKGPRPISAAGSSYKTGRKAAAEQKARAEAERRAKGTTKPKGQGVRNRKKK